MKIYLTPILLFTATIAVSQTLVYPIATPKPVTETFYNNYKVTDNYRWMENAGDADLKKWLLDEDALSSKFIAKASAKYDVFNGISRVADATYHSAKKRGKYYFTYAYFDDVSEPALFVRNNMRDDEPRKLVDPNFISRKDKISLKGYEASHDSRYLAYQYSRNGSDWAEIGVTSIEGSEQKDHLTQVKFSDICWHGNGFFYSAYPSVEANGITAGQTVLYHKLGTLQKDDEVIFKREDPRIQFEFLTTKDEQYFLLQELNRTSGKVNYFYIDYHQPQPALKPLLINLTFTIHIIDSHNGKFIAENFHNADKGSIIEIDPANATKWRAIAAPFSESLLTNVLPLNDKILAVYQTKLHPAIIAMDYSGKILRTINFPLGTSLSELEGAPDDNELLYSYQSYTRPQVAYMFNTINYESSMVGLVSLHYDYTSFEYKELEYAVNDTLKVPLMVVYKKGLKLTGNNPTLLTAYGGFGVVNKPEFDPGMIYFMNNGGVYAYAYVRGGGELGQKWADAGRGLNKPNSFNDLIAGAEYLIKQGYTNSSKIAITGESNGGLVVAAAAIKRPDLFKAVIPVVAPLDMLRFENFTVGALHAREYGSVTTADGFNSLYNYSPYNNIKPNVNYPAMLLITSDNDDRVPPLHSYKFAAQLQSNPAQTNPVLLLVNKQSGHNGSGIQNYNMHRREEANLYAFIMEMLK